ncbi:MAG: hypothetical protein R2856_16730 [Caldilineaceae bacterium]
MAVASAQVRAQVLSLKERFRAGGAPFGHGRVGDHRARADAHMIQWLGANFVNAFIAAVLAESGLSILGLGPQREMTLGMMIYWALNYSAILKPVVVVDHAGDYADGALPVALPGSPGVRRGEQSTVAGG